MEHGEGDPVETRSHQIHRKENQIHRNEEDRASQNSKDHDAEAHRGDVGADGMFAASISTDFHLLCQVVREARSLSVQTRSCAMQPAPQANVSPSTRMDRKSARTNYLQIAMALQVIMEALRKRHASGDSAPTPTS